MANQQLDAKLDEAIKKVLSKTSKKLSKALPVVGAAMVTNAMKQLKANGSVITGNLLNSLTYSTSKRVHKPSKGNTLKKATRKDSLKVGTTVVYAPRLEFGFAGKDSLGRTYDQPAKSFLRSSMTTNKKQILKLLTKMMRKTK